MTELKVFIFGPPRFELDGSTVTVQERKATAVLVFLALSGARHSRDALATMFWPGLSQAKARAALRHALWSLRSARLGEWLAFEQDQIGIQPNAWLDVSEFSRRIKQARGHSCATQSSCSPCQDTLAEAAALYRDDFLTGFTLRDAPPFDEWQYYQQERLRQELAYALERLVHWHSQKAAWAQAIRYSQRWVEVDPLNELAQRWLIWAYAVDGNRSLAIRQYAALKKTLEEDLGSAPEPETDRLAEAARSGEPLQKLRLFSPASGSPVSDRLAFDPPAHFLERARFMDRLARLFNEVRQGRGRMVFIGAEAGGGKSTLIRQFCAAVQDTVHVSVGMCDPLSTPLPFGPLWDIAAAMGGDLAKSMRAEEMPENILRTFLAKLRSERIVQLIVFEDLHWSDEATLDLLRFIGRRIETTRALVIASYRDDEVHSQHPLRTLLGDLATSAGLERMRLPPLSRQAVGVLVAGSGLDPDEVHRRTGGNPYFVAEMVTSGLDGIPDNVRDAILARVGHLTQPARSVLDSAAILGPRLEAALLLAMTGSDAATLEACMSAGILLGHGAGLAFRHDLAWQTVLEEISPLRRLGLHRRALEAMEASARGLIDLSRLAHHAEGAGDAQAVLKYAPAAARQAAAAGAHRQAAAQYERALRFSSGLPAKERAELLQEYARECHLNDRNDKALQALEEARRTWVECGELLKEGDNLSRQAAYLLFTGMNAEANQVIRSAIEILSALPPSGELVYAYNQYGRILAFDSNYSTAISMAKKAIAMGERFKDPHPLVRAHNTIGISLIYNGDASGVAYLEKSITLAREAHDYAGVALGYCNLGRWTGLMFGWDTGNHYIAEGLAHCVEYEIDTHHYFLLASQASAYLYQGRWSEAEATAKLIPSRQNLSTDTRFWAAVILGRLGALRGDPGSSVMLDEALDLAEQYGNLMFLAPVRAARAEAAWLAGKPDCAREEIHSIYDLAVKKNHVWYTGELAFWLWRAGETVDLPGWTLPVFANQIQGDWAAAAAEWERRGQPYERAWALADGDRQTQLTALDIFERLGAVPAAAALRRRLGSF